MRFDEFYLYVTRGLGKIWVKFELTLSSLSAPRCISCWWAEPEEKSLNRPTFTLKRTQNRQCEHEGQEQSGNRGVFEHGHYCWTWWVGQTTDNVTIVTKNRSKIDILTRGKDRTPYLNAPREWESGAFCQLGQAIRGISERPRANRRAPWRERATVRGDRHHGKDEGQCKCERRGQMCKRCAGVSN